MKGVNLAQTTRADIVSKIEDTDVKNEIEAWTALEKHDNMEQFFNSKNSGFSKEEHLLSMFPSEAAQLFIKDVISKDAKSAKSAKLESVLIYCGYY